MKFRIAYKKKEIELNVRECRSFFSKIRGLMFRKKSEPLLFIFKKPTRQAIHSFFCKPFVAVWFKDDKAIDVKLISSWKISVKPEKKFNKLLEIPSGNLFFRKFLDEAKI